MKTGKAARKKSGVEFIPARALTAWAVRCLSATGVPPADARTIAGSLVQTSLWGIDSHGIARLGHYLARLTAAGATVDRTDGARVLTDDGWWLLRASNTQDVLVARAEAKDEAALARLMAAIDEQLALSGVERGESVGH